MGEILSGHFTQFNYSEVPVACNALQNIRRGIRMRAPRAEGDNW